MENELNFRYFGFFLAIAIHAFALFIFHTTVVSPKPPRVKVVPVNIVFKIAIVAVAHNSEVKVGEIQKIQKNVASLINLNLEKKTTSLSPSAMLTVDKKIADYDNKQHYNFLVKDLTDNITLDDLAVNNSKNNTVPILTKFTTTLGKCFKIRERDCEREEGMVIEGIRTYKINGLFYSKTLKDTVPTDYDRLTREEVLALYVNRTTMVE